MSLLCKIIGHKWDIGAIDTEGLYEVICTRCDARTRWAGKVTCSLNLHDWKPAGVDYYKVMHSQNHNIIIEQTTRRTWRCRVCGMFKQDDNHDRPKGVLIIKDGEFVRPEEFGLKVTMKNAIKA